MCSAAADVQPCRSARGAPAGMEARELLQELCGSLRAVLARVRGGGRGRAEAETDVGPEVGPAFRRLRPFVCIYRGRTGRRPRAVRASALLGRARYGPGSGLAPRVPCWAWPPGGVEALGRGWTGPQQGCELQVESLASGSSAGGFALLLSSQPAGVAK